MDFGLGETNAGVGLELVFWHDASCTGGSFLFTFLLFLVAVLRLELVDQSVHVLIFFLVLDGLLCNCGRGRVMVAGLLIEGARLNGGVQVIRVVGGGITGVRSSRTLCVRHCVRG